MAETEKLHEMVEQAIARAVQHCPTPYMADGVELYLRRGIATGGFMQALLRNDLMESFAQADDNNRHLMFRWAEWLYNHCPRAAAGSAEKDEKWKAMGGFTGAAAADSPQ